MNFYMPAKVYSEENCVMNHAAELAALGTRALIVTGKSSARRCGAFADVTGALEKYGVSWVEFAEVEENPSVETIMRARKVGCKVEADFVIGIGGGSPMDAAKAVALMMRHPEEDWEYLYDKTAETSTVPIAEIPTTAGTGSEVTAVSVLTRHDKHVKGSIPHKIFANLALIDGKYVAAAPTRILANTTMDALCHLYESYIHSKATDYSRMCAEYGIKVWARSKDVILGRREATAEDYQNMMNASCMAGMAIAHTATSIPHALSYRLTYSAHMAHGKACGYFLAGYLREADPIDVGRILVLAGFTSIDALEDYYVTTCGRDEVPMEILEQTVEEVLGNEGKRKMPPFPVDEAVLRRIAGI
ncbi:MAG: iron-containing alcohol dehydrogenase [Lachnospiraceae bacterium]|nr:iron-containing alcohol dehydrogenase [Lachnospiraceae bacterium]